MCVGYDVRRDMLICTKCGSDKVNRDENEIACEECGAIECVPPTHSAAEEQLIVENELKRILKLHELTSKGLYFCVCENCFLVATFFDLRHVPKKCPNCDGGNIETLIIQDRRN
jgi:hypothetical protein